MNKKLPNRLGKLPPRYGFILNPHEGTRVSRCPKCEKLTYPRKFPLVIGIKGAAPSVLGKTCKYCSKCEIIIAHKDELDALIAACLGQSDGVPIANEYTVLGTIDLSFWKKSIENPAGSLKHSSTWPISRSTTILDTAPQAGTAMRRSNISIR